MLILSIDPAGAKADAFSMWQMYPARRLMDFGWIDDPVDLIPDIQSCHWFLIEDQYMHRNFKVAKQLITKVGMYKGMYLALGKAADKFALVNAATWKSRQGLLLSKAQNDSMTKTERKKYKEQATLEKARSILVQQGYDHDIDVDVASAVLLPLVMQDVYERGSS